MTFFLLITANLGHTDFDPPNTRKVPRTPGQAFSAQVPTRKLGTKSTKKAIAALPTNAPTKSPKSAKAPKSRAAPSKKAVTLAPAVVTPTPTVSPLPTLSMAPSFYVFSEIVTFNPLCFPDDLTMFIIVSGTGGNNFDIHFTLTVNGGTRTKVLFISFGVMTGQLTLYEFVFDIDEDRRGASSFTSNTGIITIAAEEFDVFIKFIGTATDGSNCPTDYIAGPTVPTPAHQNVVV